MKLRDHVGAYVSGFALLGTVVTVLGFALPTSRSWLLDHAALGWIVASVLFVVAVGQAALLSTSRTQQDGAIQTATANANQRAMEAERRASVAAAGLEQAEATLAAQLDTEVSRRDTLLLTEWLGRWRQGDDFMDYLKNSFVGDRLPLSVDRQVTENSRVWANDARELGDTGLRAAFEKLRVAVSDLQKAKTPSMWIRQDWADLRVPVEWQDEQPQRYGDAVEAIGAAGLQVLYALQNLFAVMHGKGIILPPAVNSNNR